MEALIGHDMKHPVVSYILNEIRDNFHRCDLKDRRRKFSDHITEDQQKQQKRLDKI